MTGLPCPATWPALRCARRAARAPRTIEVRAKPNQRGVDRRTPANRGPRERLNASARSPLRIARSARVRRPLERSRGAPCASSGSRSPSSAAMAQGPNARAVLALPSMGNRRVRRRFPRTDPSSRGSLAARRARPLRRRVAFCRFRLPRSAHAALHVRLVPQPAERRFPRAHVRARSTWPGKVPRADLPAD